MNERGREKSKGKTEKQRKGERGTANKGNKKESKDWEIATHLNFLDHPRRGRANQSNKWPSSVGKKLVYMSMIRQLLSIGFVLFYFFCLKKNSPFEFEEEKSERASEQARSLAKKVKKRRVNTIPQTG